MRRRRVAGIERLSRAWIVLTVAGLAAVAAGCGRSEGEEPPASRQATAAAARPVDLGSHSWKVTATEDAQRAFDRGLTLAYAFNHKAAEKEFRKAAEADPRCAMAWWGVALVNGPHINFPLVPPDKAAVAWDALGKARALAAGATGKERALIEALGTRYASPQLDDRAPLDRAYADAMRDVAKRYPEDADVAALAAEALMDLRPWDLWKPDGSPQPGTDEILGLLAGALRLDASNPLANHLEVHTLEGSPHPEKAVASAERLRDLVPGAGHLVHMPAHIFARVDRWPEAAEANVKAIAADDAFRAANPSPGLYAMYMAHNAHFLAFTAMMRGRKAEAIEEARKMVSGVPQEFLRDYAPIADGYMVFVPEALMRFGEWEAILREPEPAEGLFLARALWRFTRAVAANALGRDAEAAKEREAFHEAVARIPADRTMGNNPASEIAGIASKLLDGEIAARQGRLDEAISSLRDASAIEDRLKYDEPPDWIQPVRHTLGAVLLRAGRPADAEKVYREDLVRYPGNGWSLFGLARSLRLQKKDAEASEVEARFRKSWEAADVEIGSTCYCQPPA